MPLNVLEAVRAGNVSHLANLISEGYPTDIKDNNGWRALHVAAATNNLECMKLLVSNDPSSINQTSFDKITPLILCAIKNHADSLKYLLAEGADPNSCDHMGKSALHSAAEHGNMDIVMELLKSNADVNIQMYDGSTPLYVAVEYNRLDVVQLLIEHGADINKVDDGGYTPLHIAASMSSVDCTKLLLKLGANPNTISSCNKALPLHCALERNHIPPFHFAITNFESVTSVELLIQAGYSLARCTELLFDEEIILCDTFRALNNLVMTPLTDSILSRAPFTLCDLFLNKITTYSSIAPNEFPPLLAALSTDNLPIACHLIKHGASINVYFNKFPFNVSLFACTSQEALELLLRLGVEVESLFLDESIDVFVSTFGNKRHHICQHLEMVICQTLHHHKITPLPTKLQPYLSQKSLDMLSQHPVVRPLQEICKRTIISSLLPEHIVDGLQCLKPFPSSIINYLLQVDLIDI